MVLYDDATTFVGFFDYKVPILTRVLVSFLERYGFGCLLSGSSASVFSMYSSSFGLLALGGAHCDLGLNGCFLCCRVLLRR